PAPAGTEGPRRTPSGPPWRPLRASPGPQWPRPPQPPRSPSGISPWATSYLGLILSRLRGAEVVERQPHGLDLLDVATPGGATVRLVGLEELPAVEVVVRRPPHPADPEVLVPVDAYTQRDLLGQPPRRLQVRHPAVRHVIQVQGHLRGAIAARAVAIPVGRLVG